MSEEKKDKCQRIGGLVLCSEQGCDAMFWGTPEGFADNPESVLLPCGHKIGTITFSGGNLKRASRAEEMLVWLHSNGMILSEASRAVEVAGGSFESIRKFTAPQRDLTEDELEDILLDTYGTRPHE